MAAVRVKICLLFASVLFIGLHSLSSQTKKPKPNARETVFKTNAVYMDLGWAASSVQPSHIRLTPGILYGSALLSLDRDLRDPTRANTLQTQLLKYRVIEDWDSKTKFKIENRGYFREEASLGRYISLGALIENSRLTLSDIPLHFLLVGENFNQDLSINISMYRDGVAYPPIDESLFLYSRFFTYSRSWNFATISPELGLHLSNHFLDFYFRIGSRLLGGPDRFHLYKDFANLGLRFLIGENMTFHIEAQKTQWNISTQRSPTFKTNFIENTIRAGVGLRMDTRY